MIAHKLETAVKYSDRILVMDQGYVAEGGTVPQLLEKQGIFSALVKSLNEGQ